MCEDVFSISEGTDNYPEVPTDEEEISGNILDLPLRQLIQINVNINYMKDCTEWYRQLTRMGAYQDSRLIPNDSEGRQNRLIRVTERNKTWLEAMIKQNKLIWMPHA